MCLRKAGLRVTSIRVRSLDVENVKLLYPARVGTDRFDEIVEYMTSEPVLILLISGENAVRKVLDIKGKGNTHGLRKKYAPDRLHNVIHSSETPEEAEFEIRIWER
jgi:nucleoside-diphosphate kinase